MARISIDIAIEPGPELDAAFAELRAYDVEPTVLREVGPGGGWPEVALEGERECLFAALTGWYEMEPAEAREWVTD